MNEIIKKTYPLSYGQKAMWFIYQMGTESVAYNIFITVKINSYLNIAAFMRVWSKIFDYHPILKTTYTNHDGEPVQLLNEEQKLNIQVTDASNWSENYLIEKIFAETDRPFNLEKDSVLRVNLLTRSVKEHVLLLTMHHIAGDLWSFDLLLSEFQALYANEIEQSQEQTEVTNYLNGNNSYLEFVKWQSEMLSSSRGEQLWQYWQKQLAGELPILNLLADKPRPPLRTYQGTGYISPLDEQLIKKLKSLALTTGTSLYRILLTAFYVLLYRYTNQKDILIGSPMRGRWGGDFKEIVGYFVNLIVLRTSIQENATFTEFLAQVSNTVEEAQKHQDYPFSLLVEKLQQQQDPSRSPLCQVSFTWQPQRWCESKENSLHSQEQRLLMEPYLLGHQRGADFDLNLMVMEAKSVLQLCWQYNTDLFESTTIERMALHFVTLLEGIVANPGKQIFQLPILTEAEQQQLLVEWNDTQADYPQDKCIHSLFEEQVARTPDAVAVVFEDQKLTYGELNSRANQLAHDLQSLGVGADVLVGICVERSLEMVVGLLGILKAGGAYVPLDPEYPTERLSFMLIDAQIRVLLTQQHLETRIPEHKAQIVYLDTDSQELTLTNKIPFASTVKPSNLAYVLYTSGSTGKPKAVAIEHHSPVALVSWAQSVFTPHELAGVLASTSICFDLSVFELFVTLSTGGKVILAQNALYLPTIAAANSVTLINTVPSAIAQLIQENNLPKQICTVNLAGEALQNQLVQQIYQHSQVERVFNLYGPSEDTTYSTFSAIEKGTTASVTIGRAIANTQIYILDQYLQPVPIGVPGELHIGGAGLARGYLNRPELTQEKFIPNPFFRSRGGERLYKTGDLARYLPDGNIEYLGRIDNQVKVRGFRIELGEIETVLSQYPLVRSVVVIGLQNPNGHQLLVAYIVPQPEQTPTVSELRQFLKKKLPDYMIPNAIVILESLPLTPNGKVDRRALPTPVNSSNSDTFVSPRNTVELQLVQIWSNILKVDLVGVKDNFFDLGGHSLLASYLMSQVKQQFGKDIPLPIFLQHPTIEDLAGLLQKNANTFSSSPLVAIQSTGSNPPFFCIPGGGYPFYFHNLARGLGSDQPFYSFQTQSGDGELVTFRQVEEIAAEYIEAIKAVQPKGPYFLGGHSFGARVAFEITQQLLRQGEEIALIAIIDSVGPVPLAKPVEIDDVHWLIQTAKLLQLAFSKDLEMETEPLLSLTPDEQLKYVLDYLKRLEVIPPDAYTTTDLKRLSQVLKIEYQAFHEYAPQQVNPLPITLFRASDMDYLEAVDPEKLEPAQLKNYELLQDLVWGWSAFSSEPVDIQFVPGDHVTMMTQPHVQVLAERLKGCIQKAQAKI
ncbi:amino acid adenylation domain-containing protein [Scytonema sp. UIC 10036]|uniref:non-ribosomal peptide synthetase n=1 Tax=Scytonema sp. UIC 10036 TaxID=2304196 RepID=UPI00140FBCDB|nr:amino acid adenylation domain-containing protein [Scytonema sp. UIC 10036]